ncbi:DUF4105 domain-containing protein [Aquabacterium lacunae]|uniref:DUF4105 domain-containing protein n=1 Tax=Aquabacterium lacunae TaxID=2528630 RepID=A0A4Q9GUY5_9BURK|nr:DUF4105 domain-containing protein [Aquabacterium lacunae]TBO27933.1 DUF4105 domain-containing protein [Aquabacterium lacunae]
MLFRPLKALESKGRFQALLQVGVWVLCAGFSTGAHAAESSGSDAAWRRLLHHEPDASSATGWRSAIHSDRFFLAGEVGRTDALAERDATWRAMHEPSDPEDPDAHAQCRFPARKLWLEQHMGLQTPKVNCPQWSKWTRGHGIRSVSVVLATGYLGNPASYYGHTLLKLNPESSAPLTELQDLTINFGAIDTQRDDPLSYIVKGVSGGYDGGFSSIEYYVHRSQYGEVELRDLWDYELNLQPHEVDLVTAHAWEVLGQRYTYFFFRRNCAYRMAELLEILDGIELIPRNRPWTVPQALLQHAMQGRRADGQPLVRNVRYLPSRQSRFHDGFRALSGNEQQLVRELVNRQLTLHDTPWIQQPLDTKRAVLDTVMDRELFMQERTDRKQQPSSALYAAALAERYRLPPGKRDTVDQPRTAPHEGRSPGLLEAGLLQDGRGQTGAMLRWRAAYYDPLDFDAGHVAQGGLTMMDVRTRLIRGKLSLDRAQLLAVESVNPDVSGLKGDRGESWRIRFGLEPVLPGSEALVARMEGDWGVGRQLSPSVFVSGLVGGAAQSAREGSGLGFTRLTLSAAWQITPSWRTRWALETRHPVDARTSQVQIASTQWRWRIHRQADMRIETDHILKHPDRAVVRLGLGWYH